MPFGPGGKPSRISMRAARKRGRNPAARTALQREKDMAGEAQMYLAGKTIYQIAKAYNVSTTQIYRDIEKMRKQWHDEVSGSMELLKAEYVKKLRRIEDEANDAWERSQEDAETIETTERVSDMLAGKNPLQKVPGTAKLLKPGKKKVKATTVKREGQVGDSRFLEVARKCLTDQAALLGLNQVVQPDGSDGMKTQDDAQRIIEDRLNQLQVANAPAAGAQQPEETATEEQKPPTIN